ncbi:MAG: dephospho-CoA kinase [Rhodospirillales bacterium]|jgi:dephospho-CoA kinase|nr:dephospho-CoA kinase [Rhodospirillales bacterium]MBT4006288.1 dephospho-CoA kinase [Rhodospirillales bacterium]MBT5075676.1 dephospho-CoA kinase [Rhodospirillales bacterium]MBT5112338.1 dephospho-CoA kinase [Rhodospirillales bacterium]MBT5672039.1 dephospho-CoA kinase [Rhodospirillales bacterium]
MASKTKTTRMLGLTGSIGMGKSTAANMLRAMKVPVFSADAYVHGLLGVGGGAVPLIAKAFPKAVIENAVSRDILGKLVFDDDVALARLESILHPMVRDGERRFIFCQNMARATVAVLEIPLLFETGGETLCDGVAVLTAPAFIQKQRVLARKGMNQARFEAIRRRQMGETEKCSRADFVIPTGLGRARTFIALENVVKKMKHQNGGRGL